MKTVLKKIGLMLYEAAKFGIAIVMLALLAAVMTLGFALLPIMAVALSITKGGTLFDNLSDTFNMLMEYMFENLD